MIPMSFSWQWKVKMLTSLWRKPIDFGINELIGFGESWYYGSIASRVYNVDLTNKNLNWTVVEPGEEFSFNQALGDVDTSMGYREAYIIKDGATQLAAVAEFAKQVAPYLEHCSMLA